MPTDEHTITRSKTRGLAHLRLCVGDVTREISQRLARQPVVRVLDVGCGHGVALMELGKRFGTRVELHGVNRLPEHGDLDSMARVALDQGIHTDASLKTTPLPTIHYFDVCAAWPLNAGQFDVIYSQSSFLWFTDKIRAIEEIHRALHADGIALLDISASREDAVVDSAHAIVIHDGENKLAFARYLQGYADCRLCFLPQTACQRMWRWANRQVGRSVRSARKRPYLEMHNSGPLDLGLEWVRSQPLGEHTPGRHGNQSVYRLRAPSAEAVRA